MYGLTRKPSIVRCIANWIYRDRALRSGALSLVQMEGGQRCPMVQYIEPEKDAGTGRQIRYVYIQNARERQQA